MNSRIRILGVVMILSGLFGTGVAGYTLLRTMEGQNSLKAFSAAQEVSLTYNEAGQLVDRGDPAQAQKIKDLASKEWGYALVDSELDPKDPTVNTASEYMYQMATITYHTLNAKVTVNVPKDVEYKGETFKAGDYEFVNDGRYYSQFDRAHPIEGPARAAIWTGTALSLIGQLGVGAVTASTLTIGFGLVGVIGGLAGTLLLLGFGLVWVAAAQPEARTVTAPVGARNPVTA